MASYDKNIRIEGENSSSSLADKILELANGNKINDLNNFYDSNNEINQGMCIVYGECIKKKNYESIHLKEVFTILKKVVIY